MPHGLRDKAKRTLLVLGVCLPLIGAFLLAPVANEMELTGPWALAAAWTLMITGLSCAITWLFVNDGDDTAQSGRFGSGCCPTCGYDLEGLKSKICPECGEEFQDEAESRS